MPSDFYKPFSKHTEFLIEAYENIIRSPVAKYITAMAHPFEAVCCPYPRHNLLTLISDDTYKKIFAMTAGSGIAVELNKECLLEAEKNESEWEERIRMISIAKDMGCKFIFGSDAHSHSHFENLNRENSLWKLLSITEADIHKIALI